MRRFGIVVPVGPSRRDNLLGLLACINDLDMRPEHVVLVHDGEAAFEGRVHGVNYPLTQVKAQKHVPGFEQPRNLGVRAMQRYAPDVTHVWLLDTDLLFEADCLRALDDAYGEWGDERVMIAPYDWMPPTRRGIDHGLRNDPRWAMFEENGPERVFRGALNVGLACFSGNLVWPISQFERVGGFWNELHHGRCEDGELGLRAVAMGVPMSLAPAARGWHQWHPINATLVAERNARDVPMLNARHPWVEGKGLFVVEKDGKRFDVRCGEPGCGWEGNTAEWWAHRGMYHDTVAVED